MSLVDLLVTILVATILITIGIGLVTYLVYKLRHARVRDEGEASGAGEGRYFIPYEPPEAAGEGLAGDREEPPAADSPGSPDSGGTPGEARGS